MAVRSPKRNSAKKSSIIPVIFTLGIIGWGFFVLDRVIPNNDKKQTNKDTFFNKKSQGKTKTQEGWKQTLSSWVGNIFGTQDSHLKKKNKRNEAQKINVLEVKKDSHIGKKIEANEVVVKLYAYKETNNGLRLVTIKRKIEANSKLSLIKRSLQAVINIGSLDSIYLNSFPLVPRVISVTIDESTLIIDFNSKFGKGVSLQLLRFQLKQLVKTAVQFSQVKNIHLKINGRSIKYLGGDGIILPKKINKNNII